MVTAQIDRDTCDQLMKAITDGRRQFPADEVHLAMACRGGDTEQAFAIYEALRCFSFDVTTHNIGFVNSAAVIVYLAGRTRLAAPNSTFLLHGTSYEFPTYQRMTAHALKPVMQQLDHWDKRVNSFLLANTAIPPKTLLDSLRDDWTITTASAQSWGLTTAIRAFEPGASDWVVTF